MTKLLRARSYEHIVSFPYITQTPSGPALIVRLREVSGL